MRTRIISFVKMSGAGNDFIIIEAERRLNYTKLGVQACDRTNGIGADGLLVLSESRKADYRMRIINADGSEAEMCGNGARCLASYIFRNKRPAKSSIILQTKAGIIHCQQAEGKIQIQLSDPVDYQPDIPLKISNRLLHVNFINTGVPHTIVFVDHLQAIDVTTIGKTIRWHKRFAPRGTNVNFVEQIDENTIAVRTFERGVEAETKACGTGSVAAAIMTYLKSRPQTIYQNKARMNVITQSGEILEIIFDNNHRNISKVWLKGSANLIAEGEYYFKY